MLYADLATLLKHRIDVIGDHAFRDRDSDGHLEALKKVSGQISQWHQSHHSELHPRLEHFLTGCSYDKALRFLESDGTWTGH
ncbi:hypothetical protein [Haloferula sp.]|uniref:hypothetical protein n=1 Tax=Haloferula sp. TaxID=2497595 RepID=UPI00329C1F2F